MPCTEAQLQALVDDAEFKELEQKLGVFCPFDAVGLVHQEIRHAHFLSYVLDPRRPHGFGVACLRVFLTSACTAADEAGHDRASFDPRRMDLDGAIVRREKDQIDLLIEVPSEKLVVAVELKIGASEHGDQLARYKKTVDENWPSEDGWRPLFLFLTKRGDRPTQANWASLSLETLVIQFEDLCRNRLGGKDARFMLDSYNKMLRRRHLGNEQLEDLAQKLWDEHPEALKYLGENRANDGVKSIIERIKKNKDAFAQKLSAESGFKCAKVHVKNARSTLYFRVEKWDGYDGFLDGIANRADQVLLLKIGRRWGNTLFAEFVLDASSDVAEKLYNLLSDNDSAASQGPFPRLSFRNERVFADENGDPDATLNRAEREICAWAGTVIRGYDEKLFPTS